MSYTSDTAELLHWLKRKVWDLQISVIHRQPTTPTPVPCPFLSDVTNVGVTRGGNWWCHPIFSKKKWRPFLVIVLSKVMTFFNSPPRFHVECVVFFVNSAPRKLNLIRVSPLDSVTWGSPPSPPPLWRHCPLARSWCPCVSFRLATALHRLWQHNVPTRA